MIKNAIIVIVPSSQVQGQVGWVGVRYMQLVLLVDLNHQELLFEFVFQLILNI